MDMPNKSRQPSKLTRKQEQFIQTSEDIYFSPEPNNNERAYMARDLVQATLPHSNPRGSPPEWYRTNGNFTLSIRPGFKTNPKTKERICVGYPYGSIPRLILYWMTSEVIKKGNKRLDLGKNLSDFMRDVGLNPRNGGGARSDATRLKNQMERFFRASYSFEYSAIENDKEINRLANLSVVSKAELWWDPNKLEQLSIFESFIEISEEFFEILTSSPVPLDYRALRGLKNSPLALDLYAWLSWRSYRVAKSKKPVFISWKNLYEQIGSNYSDNKNFKRKAKEALCKIYALYGSRLKVEEVIGGIEIGIGAPLICPRIICS